MFWRMTELAQLVLARYVREGDRAVDATCGSGRDTLYLAERVGPTGTVYAFDIQAAALEAAKARLLARGLSNVVWIPASHAEMEAYVPEGVRAVVFNLGFWPEGPREIVTRTDTTRRALKAALRLIAPGGVAVVVAYPGHEEGAKEAAMLEAFARRLPYPAYRAFDVRLTNAPGVAGTIRAAEADPIAREGRSTRAGVGRMRSADDGQGAADRSGPGVSSGVPPVLFVIEKHGKRRR